MIVWAEGRGRVFSLSLAAGFFVFSVARPAVSCIFRHAVSGRCRLPAFCFAIMRLPAFLSGRRISDFAVRRHLAFVAPFFRSLLVPAVIFSVATCFQLHPPNRLKFQGFRHRHHRFAPRRLPCCTKKQKAPRQARGTAIKPAFSYYPPACFVSASIPLEVLCGGQSPVSKHFCVRIKSLCVWREWHTPSGTRMRT